MKNLTTKILTIGLTATLFAGCLTACKTTTKGINMAVSSKLEQNEAGEANKELTGPQVTVGGWSVPASHEVTEEHKKIYKDACSKYDGTGSSHEPVALLATQLVAGTNYCFYCQSTVKSSKGPLSPPSYTSTLTLLARLILSLPTGIFSTTTRAKSYPAAGRTQQILPSPKTSRRSCPRQQRQSQAKNMSPSLTSHPRSLQERITLSSARQLLPQRASATKQSTSS